MSMVQTGVEQKYDFNLKEEEKTGSPNKKVKNKQIVEALLNDKKQSVIRDFLFVTYMFKLKQLLHTVFLNQEINFGDAVTMVTNEHMFGVFTNTVIFDMTKIIGIPFDHVVGYILPCTH